jgi:adenine/guanine/hypoxanthine permease
MKSPIVGLIALAIVLTTLVGNVPLPWKMPGTVAAIIVAGIIHYVQQLVMQQPLIPHSEIVGNVFLPTQWMSALSFSWWPQMGVAVNYLPIAIPFALATVVGGIDCTESAVAAGDEYSAVHVLGVEAFATLVAALCGGITQTTPYIGHPAYKAMGGRAAYTLATAIAIGAMGLLGGFHYFYDFIPKAAVFPILIFIGLEITAQSFSATPKHHYPALAFACVPALAFLAYFYADQIMGPTGMASIANPELKSSLHTVQLLSHGFVVSSLLWASTLAMAIDRRLNAAGIFMAIASVFTMVGIIHSPMPNNSLFLPFTLAGLADTWVLPAESQYSMWQLSIGYLATSLLFFAWGYYLKRTGQTTAPKTDAELSPKA